MKLFYLFCCCLVATISELSAQVNLNEGLVAYFNFDNNCDDICRKHSLVFANNTYTTDQLNRPQSCAYFNGNQYIETADADDFTFGQNIFTISCWVRCDDTSKTGAILSKRNPWGNFEYSLDNGMNKQYWVFDHWTNGGKNAVYGSDPFKSKVILEQGVWQHIVFVSNNEELSNYINGVKSMGVDLKNSGMNFENTLSNFCIGKGGVFAKDYYFTGAIDNLRIYNRAFSANEIKWLYQHESKDAETNIEVIPDLSRVIINIHHVHSNSVFILYNLLGIPMLNFEVKKNELNSFYIDRTQLPAGVYILTDGKEIVTKFVTLY